MDRSERLIKPGEWLVLLEIYLGRASCMTVGGRALLRLGGHPDLPTVANSEYQQVLARETHGGC